MDYNEFLHSKIEVAPISGFEVRAEDVHPALKPHQRDAVMWAIRGGRRALFESFGLGKTIQELEWCRLVAEHEQAPVIIVLPLGVRQEFSRDAVQLLGMAPPVYVRTMAEVHAVKASIYMTNYERVRDGDIDPAWFAGAALDEASVLRSYGSKTFQEFMRLFRGVRYKLVATATPSPNRYKELIHYAGYLEVMDTGQALTRFFQRDSTKANNLTLYPHKEEEFWLWVSSWALFLSKPSDLGYDIEYRELVAADFGAPTTRKRFVLVARCDGKPIVWPQPTHGPRDCEAVKSGKLLPWRSAAEIIDWTIPSYSIFASKQEIKEKYGVNAVRPLADNTLRRVIRGVDKFTIKSGKPFVVECNHSGDGHIRGTEEPANIITGKYTGGVCAPVLAPLTVTNTSNSVGSPANDPVHTVTTAGNQLFVSANLMSIGQTGGGDRIRDIREPAPTAVSKQEACTVAANLIQYHTEQTEHVRASGMEIPINTVDASNRYGLTCASLVEYYGNGNPLDAGEPMHTVTAHDREALAIAHIQKYFDGGYKGCGDNAESPLSTITAMPRHGLCAAHVVKFKGQELGQYPADTLNTITAQGLEYAQCNAVLAKAGGRDLGHWPEIRALLNRHCGYTLAEDEVILLILGGAAYYIADITLRMLTPRELYNAMGFPSDYIIDRDYRGNVYGKTKQVARCGNAVCPPMAEAMVRANLPEWCGKKITTMRQLDDAVAV